MGCLIGNTYGLARTGLLDVVFGPIANLIAASLIFMLRKRQFIACVVGSLPIGFIVGGYLWLYFPPPDIFGLSLSPWLAMVISLTMSSLIALAIIGYTILRSLSNPNIVIPLRNRGLKVYFKD